MGKSTISTGPFSIAFCMFTRPGTCVPWQEPGFPLPADVCLDPPFHSSWVKVGVQSIVMSLKKKTQRYLGEVLNLIILYHIGVPK